MKGANAGCVTDVVPSSRNGADCPVLWTAEAQYRPAKKCLHLNSLNL